MKVEENRCVAIDALTAFHSEGVGAPCALALVAAPDAVLRFETAANRA